jgi:K+-sensing histidine kinase KdpD
MSVDEVFFDRVAHDLRGELATMVAGVHYLLRYGESLTPSAREMLERVSGAGDRLARLLEEFDDTVWLLDRRPELPFISTLSIGALLDDVVARVGKVAAARGVRLVVEIPESAEIAGDPDALATALAYVVDLATLRSPAQSVYIAAGVQGGAPVVSVTDEGGAVPDALLARIFEPFVEREILPREGQGRRKQRLGLGLCIARSILEAHGGSLRAETGPGSQGLILRCALPAAAAAAPSSSSRAASG